jgi:hypothetical protein
MPALAQGNLRKPLPGVKVLEEMPFDDAKRVSAAHKRKRGNEKQKGKKLSKLVIV